MRSLQIAVCSYIQSIILAFTSFTYMYFLNAPLLSPCDSWKLGLKKKKKESLDYNMSVLVHFYSTWEILLLIDAIIKQWSMHFSALQWF